MSTVSSSVLLLAAVIGSARQTSAGCFPADGRNLAESGPAVTSNLDPVARLLAASGTCPKNVFEFRSRLLELGVRIDTALVNNQGFHSPKSGNFSLFEIVSGRLKAPVDLTVQPGDFFFGHFTARQGGTSLIANQEPRGLMIELIAFDPVKEAYNFYELIGGGGKSVWMFRGDSMDVLADTALLHRQRDPANPKFGRGLRCSGCHAGGGPIMKELAAPHNDWFTTGRPLPFGSLKPDAVLAKILAGLVDANQLKDAVTAGTAKLQKSAKLQNHRAGLTLQEQLRCLFCPVELNLESDQPPFDEQKNVTVPSGFLVDPRLAQSTIEIGRSQYETALMKMKTRFPGTTRPDADHAWLAPVKAMSDIAAIEDLVNRKVIDNEFVADVLAVEFTNPVLSKARCNLLRLLPATADGDWKATFMAALKTSSDPAARELLSNRIDEKRTAKFHQNEASRFLASCQAKLKSPDSVENLFRILAHRRAEVFESEISMNPLGQILEPGKRPGTVNDQAFKLVFPVAADVQPFKARPVLHLTGGCEVVRP